MRQGDPSIEMLELAATGLESLIKDVVFPGSAAGGGLVWQGNIGIRYKVKSNMELSLNTNYNYLSRVPKIVHATGATGNGTFVPASLATQSASIWMRTSWNKNTF